MKPFFLFLLLCALQGTASAADTAASTTPACGASPTGDPKCASAGNPINVMTGNKYQVETDLPALPGVLGLEIVRYYNSGMSGRHHNLGILGRGWRLSYETELAPIGDTVQIMRADGTRLIFSRDILHPSLCTSANPADGQVTTRRTASGEEFLWRQNDGRQLTFNTQGKLVQIQAPTGEFLSLQHDARGMLVKVTDPQGRSLALNYLSGDDARSGKLFRGVQSIDSPVGRFSYSYGSALPAGADAKDPGAVLANLVRVGLPGGQDQARLYHYEDARWPTLLTGVSLAGRDGNGKVVAERYSTFGYDVSGKAVLSTHAGGVDKVTLDTSVGGRTVLTNSLGQKTTYLYTLAGGAWRLLEVRGAGCALCGEVNLRYGYDQQGRMNEVTKLDRDGQPLQATRSEFDHYGRPLKITKVVYHNGKAGAPQLLNRYEYTLGTALTPRLIARPSVVPGLELKMLLGYSSTNIQGLPDQVTEVGYVPTYDGKHAATAIVRTTRYRYNGYNQRIETDGPLPNAKQQPGPDNSDITRREYDPKSKLVTRIVAPGNVVTQVLQRDAALRPSQIRSSDGASVQLTTIQNNWRGQPEQITVEASLLNKDGSIDGATKQTRTLQYRYDLHGRLVAITAPGQLTTRFVYDVAGRLRQRILPDGSSIVMEQDTEGRQQSESRHADGDPAGKALSSLRYHYDEAGRVAQVEDGVGVSSRAQYTELGQIARMTNALGIASRFEYDDNGLLVSTTQAADTPDAASVHVAYDSQGHPTAVTDANGVSTTQRYDDFGRKIAETNPDRGVTVWRHDAGGRLVARIDESGATTRYSYDHAGRLLAMGVDQQPNLMQYRYQGLRLSEVISTVDGQPEHATGRTEYQRNALGQVTRELRWIARVDRADNQGSFKKVSFQAPLPGLTFITQSSYDEAGRPLEQVLPDGHRLRYRYGSADGKNGRPGQLTALLMDEQVIVADIEQTMAGGMTGYTMGNGVRQQIAFDSRGRLQELKAITQTIKPEQGVFARAWAQVTAWMGSKQVAAGTVIYAQSNRYDPGDRLTSIIRRQTPPGAQAVTERAEEYDYDNLGRLTKMQQGTGIATMLAYDKGGNRLSERDKNGERDYHYAAGTNRLIAQTSNDKASDTPQSQSTWLYQATGVPLVRLALLPVASTQKFSLSEESQRIVYNGAKRPIAVYGAQQQLLARYFYSADGERIAKSVYPVGRENNVVNTGAAQPRTTYSLYRDQRLSAETDADGRITTHYVYLYGKPVAKIDMTPDTSFSHRIWKAVRTLGGLLEGGGGGSDASIYAIHTDHLGTPQAVTDEHEQLVWQAETTPFGQAKVTFATVTTAGKFDMKLRLPGQVYDAETGLNQNYYRDYDPQSGRYLTVDPLGLEGGMNPYAYVNSNPLTDIDPLGLYQIDFHYYMVFYLGLAAGLEPDIARRIALASQYIDDGEKTAPVVINKDTNQVELYNSATKNLNALRYYHFMLDTLTGDAKIHDIADGNQLFNLYKAYAKSEGICAQTDFFGGLLHALGDTYSHAKTDDKPYNGVDLGKYGIGHGFNGSDPDYTFTHWGFPALIEKTIDKLGADWQPNEGVLWATYWPTNGTRTLDAEKDIFKRITELGVWETNGKKQNINDIEAFLVQFNKIGETEQGRYTWTVDGSSTDIDPNKSDAIQNIDRIKDEKGNFADVDHGSLSSINKAFSDKLALLNQAIKKLGYEGDNAIDLTSKEWGYNVNLAKSYNQAGLAALSCKDFPGVILPNAEGACPMPKTKVN